MHQTQTLNTFLIIESFSHINQNYFRLLLFSWFYYWEIKVLIESNISAQTSQDEIDFHSEPLKFLIWGVWVVMWFQAGILSLQPGFASCPGKMAQKYNKK